MVLNDFRPPVRPVAALCAPNGHLTAPSNADGAALAHRPLGVCRRGRGRPWRGLMGCSPRWHRETARSAMVGPAKCMVRLGCAWSRWRAGAMRQRQDALLPWCAGSAWKKAAYAVAGYRWLSPASFSPTLIVCPRHYCVSGGLSPPAAPLPPPLTCRGGCFFLLLPLTPLGGQVVTDVAPVPAHALLFPPPLSPRSRAN